MAFRFEVESMTKMYGTILAGTKRFEPLRRWPCKCGLVAAAVLASISPALAEEPTDPKDQEPQDFAAKLDRIKSNPNSQPIQVDDTIKSLTMEVTKSFNCPDESAVTSVTIKITTRHIHFDRDLTIGGKATNLPPHRVGYYVWNTRSTVERGTKTIVANNFVMLDPKITKEQEATPPFGPLADEGLLYHELLHGELLIEAMNTPAWQKTACNCTFDLSPSDANHASIPGLVQKFLTNRSPATAVRTTTIEPEKAEEDGSFSIPIAKISDFPTDKEICVKTFYPENSNIDQKTEMVVFDRTKDMIILKGMLQTKTESGFLLVHIDPPTDVLFIEIESGVVILPASLVAIPTLGHVGVALLIGLLLFFSLAALRKSKVD